MAFIIKERCSSIKQTSQNMAKKKATKRAMKYEPKVALKPGVDFDDLIKLSLKDSKKEPKTSPKSK